jgi:hypothetical protein
MKTISVLLALAAATAVQSAEDAVSSGSIRASRKSARGETPVQYPVEKKKERKVLSEKQLKMHSDAIDRHLSKKNAAKSEATTKDEAKSEADTATDERELTSNPNFKAKTGLSKLMYQDDAYRAGGRLYGRFDDDAWRAGGRTWLDDDASWHGKQCTKLNLCSQH